MKAATSQEKSPYADASPSKYFFCHMLTRDIELKDAIMDLIDNCVDGAMRTKGTPPKIDDGSYYEGFNVDVYLTENEFIIKDNCGGIPRKIAKEYAFRFGRPEAVTTENNLPTIGLYGIGMKRAIFKIGEAATIYTKTGDDDEYCVSIPSNWTRAEKWEFPIREKKGKVGFKTGTTIAIDIKNDIAEFTQAERPRFIEELKKSVAHNFGLIIHKGLKVTINGNLIKGVEVSFVIDEHPSKDQKDKKRYLPYIYSAKVGGVDVFMILGFYSRNILASEDDIEEELLGMGHKRTSEDAGWTVVCNDRIVLYNNKDHLTGWGEYGLPRYHTQFIGIKGIVYFSSNDPAKLPTTTVKRGIDLNSEIYASVKRRMCMALKTFIDYTNKWKGKEEEEKKQSLKSESVQLRELLKNRDNIEEFLNIKMNKVSRPNSMESDAAVLIPSLPLPKDAEKFKRISFLADIKEYGEVAEYFFEDDAESTQPSEVGKACFKLALKKARGEK